MWHRIGKHGEKYWGRRGAGILFTDGKGVLLLKRSKKCDRAGQWGCPGGKAKEGETFLGTAQRETKEEIGHLPKGSRIGQVDTRDGHHSFRTYVCTVPDRFECELSDEHDDYHWFPIEDLKHVQVHDKMKKIIGDLVEMIDKNRKVKHEMSGFAEFVSLSEIMGATADLVGGYKGGPDWQVEGDPSSMFPQYRRKKRKKKSKKK